MTVSVTANQFTDWQSKLRQLNERRLVVISDRDRQLARLQQASLELPKLSLLPSLSLPVSSQFSFNSVPLPLFLPSFEHSGIALHSPISDFGAASPFYPQSLPTSQLNFKPNWSWSTETLSQNVGVFSSNYLSPQHKGLNIHPFDNRPSSSGSYDSVASIKRSFDVLQTSSPEEPSSKRFAYTPNASPIRHRSRSSISPNDRASRTRQASAGTVPAHLKPIQRGQRFSHGHSLSLGSVPAATPAHNFSSKISPGLRWTCNPDSPQYLMAPFENLDPLSIQPSPSQLSYYQLAAGHERGIPVINPQPYYSCDGDLFPPLSRRPSFETADSLAFRFSATSSSPCDLTLPPVAGLQHLAPPHDAHFRLSYHADFNETVLPPLTFI